MSRSNVFPVFKPALISRITAEFACPHCHASAVAKMASCDDGLFRVDEEDRWHQCESCKGFIDFGAAVQEVADK